MFLKITCCAVITFYEESVFPVTWHFLLYFLTTKTVTISVKITRPTTQMISVKLMFATRGQEWSFLTDLTLENLSWASVRRPWEESMQNWLPEFLLLLYTIQAPHPSTSTPALTWPSFRLGVSLETITSPILIDPSQYSTVVPGGRISDWTEATARSSKYNAMISSRYKWHRLVWSALVNWQEDLIVRCFYLLTQHVACQASRTNCLTSLRLSSKIFKSKPDWWYH